MPCTVNGIGTHYYGKKNLRRRPAICDHCGQPSELSSYDTRLWGVVFFIPVIPLGRKRVIDDCSRCRRHRVMGWNQWDLARREAINTGMQKLKESPRDADAAIALHRTLLLSGEWELADQVAGHLEREFPDDAHIHKYLAAASGYRGEFEAAEKHAARAEAIDPAAARSEPPAPPSVPPRRISRRGVVLAGIVVLLLLGALIYADRRAVNHRQLHVVNGYLAPIGVRLNDAEVSSVPPVTHVEFDIPEGEYRAQVTGPVNAEYTFTIASSFIARLFDRRVFVLNPGGMAVVLREEVLYIPRGRERDAEAPKIEAHFGFTCKEFERIDYPFADFPPEIQLKGSRETTKSRLAHYISPPLGLMYALLESHKPRAALDFAEWGIDTLPWGSQLLPLYAQVGANPEHHERVRKNLRSRLGRRPVDIVLHHAYQDCSRGAERAGLEAEYDQYLGEEPRSSALLYLRGRIAPGLQEAAKYFDQAVEIDPRNGWAHFAAAFGFASRGLWKDASQAVERALEIDPENLQVQELRFEIRLGLAEGEAMEKALGEEVAREAHADARKVFRLVGLASLRGDRDGALGHCDAFAKAHGASDPEGTAGIRSWLRCHSLYVLGDFAGMEQEAARARLGSGKTHRMEALIELGRVDEAARLGPDADEPDQDPFLPLTRSISCHLSGDAARAAAERTLALELMKGGAPEIARVPGFLAGPKAPPLADVLDLSIGPQDKATLLVVIAQTFPGAPAEFRAQARTLNASLNFPRHLLGRAIDKLESTR